MGEIGDRDSECTRCEEHWVVYGVVKPPHCTSETSITLQAKCTGIKIFLKRESLLQKKKLILQNAAGVADHILKGFHHFHESGDVHSHPRPASREGECEGRTDKGGYAHPRPGGAPEPQELWAPEGVQPPPPRERPS